MSLSTAKSCDSPPPEHRRYIGFNQVYYNGDCVGYITDGKFRTFMISDDLLEGFFHLSSDDYDNAYRVWQILGGFNNKGALFNLGVMNYLGVGFNKNYASAANYFNIATQSRTHFNTAYASIVRTLQSSLIELGYLDGYADGDYGIKTETALNRSLSEISPGTHQEFDILGDLYTYFDDIFLMPYY